MKCDCPIYCPYCGRHRSRDSVGHYCKTENCQWQHGYARCFTPRKNDSNDIPHIAEETTSKTSSKHERSRPFNTTNRYG